MARLPGEQDLGPAGVGMSGRPIATYDTSGYARGAAAMAQGAQDLGKGLLSAGRDASMVAEQGAKDEEKLEVSRAQADFRVGKIELDSKFKDDNDHETLQDRYDTDLAGIREKAAANIRSPRARELFENSIADDIAKAKAGAGLRANQLWKDATLADANTRLENLRRGALESSDPEETTKMVQTGHDLIDSLAGKNILTKEGAGRLRREWAEKYAKGKVEILADTDPELAINALRARPGTADAITGRILQIEGYGKNPNSSATGAGQFIESTWLDVIKRHRPDLAAGRSDEDLLAMRSDRTLGRQMTEALRAENEATLTRAGVNATPGAQYLAHFLGAKGAIGVLKADPNQPVQDVLAAAVGKKKAAEMVEANPTILNGKLAGSVTAWADSKMGGAVPGGGAVFDILQPDDRARLLSRAEANRDRRITDDLAGFKARVADTTAEAMTRGTVEKPVSQGEFITALGADAGLRAHREYVSQLQLGNDISRLAGMSIEDQQKLLESYAPAAGSVGFANAAKRQKALDQAIERDRKLRATDPEFKSQVEASIAESARTGNASNAIERGEFVRRFGEEDGARAFASYQASLKLGRDVLQVRELSLKEQDELLKVYTPEPGSADYVDAGKRYDALRKAIDQDRKVRATDPEFKQQIEASIAEAGRSGTVAKPIDRAEFVRRFGEEDGNRAFANYNASLTLGRDVHSLGQLAPREQLEVLQAYAPAPGSPEYSDQAKRYDVVQKALAQLTKERNDDPAAYAIRRLPAVTEAYTRLNETLASPTATPADKQAAAREYAIKSDLEQARIGVPPDERRLVPQDYIDNLNAKLAKPATAGGTVNVANMIQGEAQLWGEAWPQVYRQLSKSATPAVMVIGSGVKPAAAQILTEFANTDMKAIANDQSEEKMSTIRKDVRDAFRPLSRSMVGNEGAQPAIDAFQGAGEKLAAYYVRNGMSSSDAAAKAFEDLLGHKYDFSAGTYRVPKSVPFTPSAIASGVAAAKEQLANPPSGAPSGAFAGELERGNIDLNARPRVKNADGTVSTTRSISVEFDGQQVLIPTVSDNGKILSDEDAIAAYRQSGKHLGKFDTVENASAYAKALSEQQAKRYAGGPLDVEPARDTIGGLSGEYLRSATGRAYARDGIWVTSPDETGLALIYKDQAVRRADGKPVVLTWQELATMGNARVDRDMLIVPGGGAFP
jgi:DNA-binding TFAR19-related protein (PDSD5 family)